MAAFKSRAVAPLQYADVVGTVSSWERLESAVADLDAISTIGLATQWSVLIQGPQGQYLPAAQERILREILTPRMAGIIAEIRSRKMQSEGWEHDFLPPVIHKWQLRILIQLVLRLGRWSSASEADLPKEKLVWILLAITDHLHGHSKRRRGSQVLAEMLAVWDINHQRQPGPGLTRTFLMLRDIAVRIPTKPDLPSLFEASAGISLDTYLGLSMATATVVSHLGATEPEEAIPVTGNIGLPNLTTSRIRGDSAVTEAEALHFLGVMSDQPAGFAEKLQTSIPVQTNFSVMRQFPLLQMGMSPDGQETFRLLDRMLIMDKLSEGAFWLTQAGARDTKAASVQEVTSAWGRLFEEYAHELCSHSAIASDYTPRPMFPDSVKLEGDIDGLIVSARTIVVLEYKCSPLTVASRSGGDAHALVRDIIKKYGARVGVGQLATVVSGLLEGRTLGPATLDAAGEVFPLLVCWDSIMDGPLVNRMLERCFRRQLRSRDPRVKPLTVVSIETFERMLSGSADMAVAEMLKACQAADPNLDTSPAHILDSIVLQGKREVHPWLEERGRKWTEDIVVRFWPNGPTARRRHGTSESPAGEVQ